MSLYLNTRKDKGFDAIIISTFKGADDKNHTLITKKQLHQKLAAFKKKHPNDLYVRIIIPEKSGLTYNEAWNFMRGLLTKYDYYYQDK